MNKVDKGRLKMGQYKGKFKNKIINNVREKLNEKNYEKLDNYLFNFNKGNSRYQDYVRNFEEKRIGIINEIVDSISEMKIEEVVERIDVNNIKENTYGMRAGIDFDYKLYSLEIKGEIENYTGEKIKEIVMIPYVAEFLTYNYNGETEIMLYWI